MASEMVEAVAKAIVGRMDTSYSWQEAVEVARAAIAAMREPTEAMEVAAEDVVLSRPASQKHAAATVWQAMIDEALKDQPGAGQ
jgi:hypothetical protein